MSIVPRLLGLAPATVASALLLGCGASAGLLLRPADYLGQDEAQIVARLGPPLERRTGSDGSRLLLYARPSTLPYGGQAPPRAPLSSRSEYGWRTGTEGDAAKGGSAPVADLSSGCVVTFSLDASGVARAWATQGGDCSSR